MLSSRMTFSPITNPTIDWFDKLITPAHIIESASTSLEDQKSRCSTLQLLVEEVDQSSFIQEHKFLVSLAEHQIKNPKHDQF